MNTIYGVAPSPFVRKVLLAHAYKNIPFEIQHTFPGSEDEEFRQMSPLGKIPAYKSDTGVAFSDSSVIIAYLERMSNIKPLYPSDNDNYALALWLEEYADTKMMEATGALYFQRIIGPKFFSKEIDQERVTELTTQLIPETLNFIEGKLQDNKWILGDDITVADLSIGTNLVNLYHADFSIDKNLWPKLAAYNERFLALDMVKAQIETERNVFNSAA